MGLFSKLAWLALPALAGCGVLSQVSSQGPGASPGGNASGDELIASNQLLAMLTRTTTGTGQLVWNGEPIAEEDLVELKPESDGTLRVPVVTKEGKIDPFWKLDSTSFLDQPIEAGKAPSLSVGSADAKTQVLISKPESEGKLSSKKFEITSDMKKLQMRIIGNGDMTSTYVRLLVSIDGKAPIGWSQQAPTSSRIFEKVEWDLSKVLERAAGKGVTAQIDIVDGSKAQVIGIGEVASSSNLIFRDFDISNPSNLIAEPGANLQHFGLKRTFFNQSIYNDPNKFNLGNDVGLLYDFGVSPKLHGILVEEVSLAVYRYVPHVPTGDVRPVASKLEQVASNICDRYGIPSDRKFLIEWLKAEALCAYSISRITYDTKQTDPSVTYNDQVRLGAPGLFLNAQTPMAICNGYARFVRDTGRAMGLDVQYVGGYFRLPTSPSQPTSAGHGWNLFKFSNGIVVPADTTNGYSGGDQSRWLRVPRKVGWSILPRTPRAMELFTAMYLQVDDVSHRYGDPQANLNLLSITKEKWLSTDISHYQGLFSTHYLALDGNAVVNGR